MWLGQDSISWCDIFSLPCRSVQFSAGVENMVWFDRSDSKIVLPKNVKTLSAKEAELMLPTFCWFESEEVPMSEHSMFPIPERTNLTKIPKNGATMTIPMYPLYGKYKGKSLKPSFIRKQTGEWTYKTQFQNNIKFRVN